MFNEVRLIIWDLDETFWGGTLAEGGIQYNQRNHDIVIDLAKRGILSSICSKNDRDRVKEILESTGIWDYFIFPSIDWTVKGPRVASIVEAVQLRPPTILFVDDNPSNRAEVADAVTGIQVCSVDLISQFLDHPAFKGKDDQEMTRVKQYKLLEIRRKDIVEAEGNTTEFLHKSDIRVDILYEVEAHMERAIELINRTNQLNFTKRRLPDDFEAAAQQLRSEMAPFYVRAGLVSARDRYGDFGIIGFFLCEGIVSWGQPELMYFCFSCRTLGMGVEQYVYNLLGRPRLTVIGEVVSDPTTGCDWINQFSAVEKQPLKGDAIFQDVVIRGSCELDVISHFFSAFGGRVRLELTEGHGMYYMPRHDSGMTAQALSGLTANQRFLIRKLGMSNEFYSTSIFDAREAQSLVVFSPGLDVNPGHYRHRETGLLLSVWFKENYLPDNPHRTADEEYRYNLANKILQVEFEFIGDNYEERLQAARRAIIDNIPNNVFLIILLPNSLKNVNGSGVVDVYQARLNEKFHKMASGRKNIALIDVTTLIKKPEEIRPETQYHFEREVYWRIFEAIRAEWSEWKTRTATASPPPPTRSSIELQRPSDTPDASRRKSAGAMTRWRTWASRFWSSST